MTTNQMESLNCSWCWATYFSAGRVHRWACLPTRSSSYWLLVMIGPGSLLVLDWWKKSPIQCNQTWAVSRPGILAIQWSSALIADQFNCIGQIAEQKHCKRPLRNKCLPKSPTRNNESPKTVRTGWRTLKQIVRIILPKLNQIWVLILKKWAAPHTPTGKRFRMWAPPRCCLSSEVCHILYTTDLDARQIHCVDAPYQCTKLSHDYDARVSSRTVTGLFQAILLIEIITKFGMIKGFVIIPRETPFSQNVTNAWNCLPVGARFRRFINVFWLEIVTNAWNCLPAEVAHVQSVDRF